MDFYLQSQYIHRLTTYSTCHSPFAHTFKIIPTKFNFLKMDFNKKKETNMIAIVTW